MNYHHRFTVNAPLGRVAEFHSRSASMGAITPPPVLVRIHSAPAVLAEGDAMDFTMWLGPLPLRWQARIEQVSANGFVDRLERGPFTRWDHRHSFNALGETTTVVSDDVEIELSQNWFWKLVGLGMWLTLPMLFAYRQWKTKRILEQNAAVA